MAHARPQNVESRKPAERRALAAFLGAFLFLVGLAVIAKWLWLYNVEFLVRKVHVPFSLGITGEFLETDAGPIARVSQDGREILGISFPGYDSVFEMQAPRLNERNEFSVATLSLQDGRRVRVKFPQNLVFDLAATAQPSILILGTSHTREGLRPDVVAKGLGVERAINASVSGGSMRTIELILSRFVKDASKRMRLIVIEVAPVSLTQNDAQFASWKKDFEARDGERGPVGRIKARFRTALDYLPRVGANNAMPFQHSRKCADGSVRTWGREEAKLGLLPRFLGGIDPREVAALRRVAALAESAAERVVYVEMPVTPQYRARMGDFPFDKVVTSVLGPNGWLRGSITDWGLTIEDYLGSKSRPECKMDGHHLNERGAVRFSEAFAKALGEPK